MRGSIIRNERIKMKIKIYSQSVLSKLVDPPLDVVSDKAFY